MPKIDRRFLNRYGRGAVALPLTRGRIAWVDELDLELVSPYSWHLAPDGPCEYAATTVYGKNPDGRSLLLHVLLMGRKGVDHIDGSGLNNRRSNLRYATHSENMRNKKRSWSNSGLKGVYRRPNGRYASAIFIDGRLNWLGTFRTARAAAKAYDESAIKRFGEFAAPNSGHY